MYKTRKQRRGLPSHAKRKPLFGLWPEPYLWIECICLWKWATDFILAGDNVAKAHISSSIRKTPNNASCFMFFKRVTERSPVVRRSLAPMPALAPSHKGKA